ncbi:hypothetical protein CSPX01_14028 [Colletotrichum filicis]|nr:hypothetical protein CSPX01_14028 [Colletotrichum filicis]
MVLAATYLPWEPEVRWKEWRGKTWGMCQRRDIRQDRARLTGREFSRDPSFKVDLHLPRLDMELRLVLPSTEV